jgi:hypothetical protein
MAKVGAPRAYSDAEVAEICQKFEEYIDRTEVPILSEFLWMNKLPKMIFYQYPEIATLREFCMQKKQAQIERLCSTGQWDVRMGMFSLRQMGWSDKHEVEHSGKIDTGVQIYLPDNGRVLDKDKKDD